MPDPNPNPNPTPDPAANPNPGNPNPAWYSSIDFGDAKDTASKALEGFKTPTDLLGALDWRKAMSGGDEKALKQFERFATLSDAGKAYREAAAKISSGELAKPLPKDATPEQVAEWRKGNGIPEKPEGYFDKLPNGLVVGEDDRPLFDGFAKSMHELHAPPAMIHKAVEWYYGMQNSQIEAQKAADGEAKSKLGASLKEAWGADFQANSNIYQSFVASAPEAVREVLTTARDVNGDFILYRPEVVSWLTAHARELNPAGHIVPADGGNQAQSVQAEIAKIEKVMATDRRAYNADNAMQERLRQLYDARTKLQERGRAA